jgi:diadenosine tetraphosphate (Ap4A) HIT family hydrolase
MCIFCDSINGIGDIVLQEKNLLVSCFFDTFPVTQYHMLFITNRHVSNYFDLWMDEKCHIDALIMKWSKKLQIKDQSITGFNIGWNCGYSAGQTIDHAHCHLIPRRDSDIKDPTGGVRGVIPHKRIY